MSVYTLDNGLAVFKALSSKTRARIFSLIQQREGMNIKQIAEIMKVPVTTLSPHINVLNQCGLIYLVDKPMGHGVQKCCYPAGNSNHLLIDLNANSSAALVYYTNIPIGSYSDFSVTPTCGLATSSSFIGQLDEPRFFAHPFHTEARILWFTTGYVEYILPCFIPRKSRIEEISVSFEISSECPRYNDEWPSDITFSLNGVHLGCWKSPGDYGSRPGKTNPDWWFPFLNQYGLLKRLSITSEGTFLDEEKLSDVTTGQLMLTDQSVLKLRIAVLPDSEHPNGCTLFGSGFGDYDQDIQAIIRYIPQ